MAALEAFLVQRPFHQARYLPVSIKESIIIYHSTEIEKYSSEMIRKRMVLNSVMTWAVQGSIMFVICSNFVSAATRLATGENRWV